MSALGAGEWLWAAWYVTWWIPALWSPKPKERPPRGGSMLDRVLAGLGALLLFLTPTLAPGRPRAFVPLWTEGRPLAWSLFALILAGFALCWWARVHLGRLWSGLVTVKADHRVVQSGPYGLVRHPIYTGVMVSAVALALIKATPAAVLGAGLMVAGFYLTARKEELFLAQALDPGAYDGYRRRGAMLVPFARRRSRAIQPVS